MDNNEDNNNEEQVGEDENNDEVKVLNRFTINANTIKEHWKLILIEGIVFIVLGALAMILPKGSSFAVEIILGWIILFAGIFQFIRVVKIIKVTGLSLSLLTAIVTIICGGLLVFYPLAGVFTLTALLAAYFFIDGICKIIMGFQKNKTPKRGWVLINGFLSLIIGILIWSQWPLGSVWFVGFLVGICLVFFGSTMIMLGFSAKRELENN